MIVFFEGASPLQSTLDKQPVRKGLGAQPPDTILGWEGGENEATKQSQMTSVIEVIQGVLL